MVNLHTADVDECAEGTSGCSQECTNTIGGFVCSCVEGYELEAFVDGKICNGMRMTTLTASSKYYYF